MFFLLRWNYIFLPIIKSLKSIYDLYNGLKYRQERIKPLLPLRILASGKNAEFDFVDYDDAIISVQKEYATYLYNEAKLSYNQGRVNKMNYRRAYDDFQKVSRIYPHFKDIDALMEECHSKGTDFVHVAVFNETDQIIPRRLESYLLAIDTYGLNDFWTVYHAQKNRNQDYDFDL